MALGSQTHTKWIAKQLLRGRCEDGRDAPAEQLSPLLSVLSFLPPSPNLPALVRLPIELHPHADAACGTLRHDIWLQSQLAECASTSSNRSQSAPPPGQAGSGGQLESDLASFRTPSLSQQSWQSEIFAPLDAAVRTLSLHERLSSNLTTLTPSTQPSSQAVTPLAGCGKIATRLPLTASIESKATQLESSGSDSDSDTTAEGIERELRTFGDEATADVWRAQARADTALEAFETMAHHHSEWLTDQVQRCLGETVTARCNERTPRWLMRDRASPIDGQDT